MLDLKGFIEEVGMAPLFRSRVARFSIEEMFPQAKWWTGTQDDPWEMRIALSQDSDIVYAKLFDKKAGFVHRRLYADLLNLRRDGYDFDTLVDEGRAGRRERCLMQAMQSAPGPLLSPELKRNAGFAKGGTGGYDGACAALEQNCYLLYAGFSRRIDRFGREYGWEIGLIDTPEHRFGEEYILSAYESEPAESLERLTEQVCRALPALSQKDVRALIAG